MRAYVALPSKKTETVGSVRKLIAVATSSHFFRVIAVQELTQ